MAFVHVWLEQRDGRPPKKEGSDTTRSKKKSNGPQAHQVRRLLDRRVRRDAGDDLRLARDALRFAEVVPVGLGGQNNGLGAWF